MQYPPLRRCSLLDLNLNKTGLDASAVVKKTGGLKQEMAVIAGMDEVGYGPKVGPLVVTACAFRTEGGVSRDIASSLGVVSPIPHGGMSSRKMDIVVDDSKKVYRLSGGRAWLERAVLAFSALSGLRVYEDSQGDLAALLDSLGVDTERLTKLPWYSDLPRRSLPAFGGRAAEPPASDPIQASLSFAPTSEMVFYRVRVVSAGEFNEMLEQEDNKAVVLWRVVSGLVRELMDVVKPGETCDLLVDRLGGRSDYSGLLCDALLGARVREVRRTRSESAYLVGLDDGRQVNITFRTKADADDFTVALASMTGKYVRELCMSELNRYFASHVAGLAPTTGYYSDVGTFVAATAEARERLGIEEKDLVRQR